MQKLILFVTLSILVSACNEEVNLDLLIINGDYYTATSTSDNVKAIGIIDDKIHCVGTLESIEQLKGPDTKVIDANNQFVMPGFIEGHGHFSGMGSSLQNLNFLKDTSWQAIVDKVQQKVASSKKGEWIYGRGWHQEKWKTGPEESYGAYPMHQGLSEISQDNPVVLIHASGHSLFANEKAMQLSGISIESPDPKGGHIVKNNSGQLVGVFEERAMKPILAEFDTYKKGLDSEQQKQLWYDAISLAQEECLANGVTSFQDAGSKFFELERYTEMAEKNQFDIRLWAMVRHSSDELKGKLSDYKKIGIGNNHFTCRAIKTELDGALGAHGAWLLEPYEDKKEFYGQNTTEVSEVAAIAKLAYDSGMQLCVHAIGDRANSETLDIIENYQNKSDDPLRWRVEHAQHLNPNDIMRFKSTGAIASMQGVHCTSDAPFVVKRLGQLRAKVGAYAWKALLNQDVKIVNGTDVPVEDIDPFENYYASVTRKRMDNGMEFFVENRMSREQALKSYTLDAAYGAFEEDIKGSLEVGKLADIVILDTNLLTCDDLEIPDTKVLYTIVGGKIKYKSESN